MIPQIWAIAVTLIRSSIIFLYIRIFPTQSFRFTCYTVLILNGSYFIGVFLATFLICIPIACLFSGVTCNSCGNLKLFQIFHASINLILDITVVVLPTPVLWGLQMAMSKKLVLSGMFGLGAL